MESVENVGNVGLEATLPRWAAWSSKLRGQRIRREENSMGDPPIIIITPFD
mgnify:CR=1 FL=1